MREILFRGISEATKTFVFGDLVQWTNGKEILVKCLDSESVKDKHKVIPETIGQFTGLIDDNGKKIFEGDILNLVEIDYYGDISVEWNAVVEFGNPNSLYNWGFQLKPLKKVARNTDILLWVETELDNIGCCVIGNIHENPELLKENDNVGITN